jgi:hypothetical protein
MTPCDPTASEVATGVQGFDAVFADMEEVLWIMSIAAREQIIHGQALNVIEGLVWTIKSWWGVQGVRTKTKSLIAQAIADQPWKPADFKPLEAPLSDGERFAIERVEAVVRRSVDLGAGRQEYSLVSKTLHWLLPWRVPVYDSFVRSSVGVPQSWKHREAYDLIVQRQYRHAHDLMAAGSGWIGEREPRFPFRALDKYLWWIGGGNEGRAAVVTNPWSALYPLGIRITRVSSQ